MFIDTDKVTGLAGVWGEAAKEFTRAGERIRARQREAENHGGTPDALNAIIGSHVERHAEGIDAWSAYHADFGRTLLAIVDSFSGVDATSAQNLRHATGEASSAEGHQA